MSETEATFSYKKYIYILTFENLNVFFAKGLVFFYFCAKYKVLLSTCQTGNVNLTCCFNMTEACCKAVTDETTKMLFKHNVSEILSLMVELVN